jgi:hypothetical protein
VAIIPFTSEGKCKIIVIGISQVIKSVQKVAYSDIFE